MKISKHISILTIVSLSLFCNISWAKTPEKSTTKSVIKSSKDHLQKYKAISLKLSSNEVLKTYIAATNEEQTLGLSGIQDKEFEVNEAMLFYYKNDDDRMFWMPDTYFDLDIFFLDSKFTVLAVERDVPFHPGRSHSPKIPITKQIFCRHVLEIKSKSSLAKKLKPGHRLTWQGPLSQWEIESSIR